MPNDFNQQVIDEFRANRGRVGGYFEGARLLLLTTTGARTGTPHTAPVGYLPDGGDRVLVIASAATPCPQARLRSKPARTSSSSNRARVTSGLPVTSWCRYARARAR